MSKVVMDIDIAAPPEKVWEVVMDPSRFGEWVTIHRKINKVDSGPVRAGMKMEQVLCLRGAHFKVKWTLDECREGRRAVWEGKGPVMSHAHTAYVLEPGANGGTHFHYENEFKAPAGPLGAAASKMIVGGLPEREARASLQKLKTLLENSN